MDSFLEIVDRAQALLETRGRVSLRALRREFSIDGEVLEDLAEELVELQVAIREGNSLVLRGDASPAPEVRAPTTISPAKTSATSQPATVAEATEPAHAAPETGERRQLTVVFCDLVDSTRMSALLDPEDWREVIALYHQAVAAAVNRFEGRVAQYLGDGVLAYFGHPVSHENDGERAVRAGLAITNQMEELNIALRSRMGEIDESVELRVRIGVHTGPVVIGEVGESGSEQILALGETTNLAARLQDEAPPDTVVMTRQTRRLVQGVFSTRDLGERDLKGIAEPVQVIEAVRVTGVRSRLDVLAAGELTPLVGRDQELGLFEDRFGQVADSLGHVLLVNGEAGIGKSRLIHAFRERMQDRPHSWLECRCSPYTQDSAFHPILDLLRQGLGFRSDQPAADQVSALEAGLEASGLELAANLPLLTEMFGLPAPDGYEALKLAPEGKRIKSLRLLVEWVLRLARSQPLVLLVEDLHWVDPSTLEWLGGLLDEIPRSQVLLVLTYRPDFEPPWPPKGHATPIQLSRMTRAQISDLVRKSAPDREIPEEWLDQIIRRSDGVPLFAEELTRTVLETNPDVPRGEEVPTLHIPETLQDSLMARLDALGPVKELAQLGAVLGREFDYDLLLQVSPLREDALQSALDVAVQEELFYRRGTPPDATFLFKHALIRDAAYQSLLRSQRQRYHRRIAETIRDRSPETLEENPERIAHHFAEAGEAESAIPLLQAAALLSTERSAHTESEAHLRRAIVLLAEIEDPQRYVEFHLYGALAATATTTHGYGSEEFGHVAQHLGELIEACPDHPAMPGALGNMGNFYRDSGQLDAAERFAKQQIGFRDYSGLDIPTSGYTNLLMVSVLRARYAEGIACLDRIGPFDRERETLRIAVGGGSGFLSGGGGFGSWMNFCSGHPMQAIELSEEMIRCSRLVEHPLTTATLLTLVSCLRIMTREYRRSLELSEEAGRIASENGLLLWSGLSALSAAAARTALGEAQGSELFAAVQASGQVGVQAGIPFALWLGAGIQRASQQAEAALETIDGALTTFTPVGQVFWHAELHRLRGEILADEKDDPEAADASFSEALEIARLQEAKGLELRAATSYGRLLRDQGRAKQARTLLAPVYERFTEGHTLPDLVDAKALLEELGD